MRMELRALDQLLPADQPARVVWDFVQKLDLCEYYADIKSVAGHVGRPAVDPAILLSLWLLATLEGIGSARRIAELCIKHIAYEWLCGEVGINHHILSDFRRAQPERLEKLLIQMIAVLLDQGLVSLQRVAQDGMRVRASAGGSSFRRQARLQEHLADAQAQVDTLKSHVDDDPGAVDRRAQAARERAARERQERIEHALEQLSELAEKREQRKKGDGEQARCSTTDPDARRMKMADGGTRPAYNVQLATTADTRLIVGWNVINSGSDRGQLDPMVEQLQTHFGQRPREYLADGGFATNGDIEKLAAQEITVFAPVKCADQILKRGADPFVPRAGDSEVIGAWRQRMGTASAQEIYRQRSGIAEFPNAVFRNRGFRQFVVRGLEKVKASTLWQAPAFNFTRLESRGWLSRL